MNSTGAISIIRHGFFFRHTGKVVLRVSVCAAIFIALISPACSQHIATRPRIGLALSGGGACGIAHVGVIRVLEEAGLRPDFISGVSMGSIIGGMYATGYSADSLEYLIRSTDWNNILENRIPENKVIFQEKKYFMNSILALPVTFRKVILPTGLINGQQVENMLSYHLWHAADISDFSNLPIPFLCLGSDIVNNKRIVLNSGYLPDAIRASIAVPSILTPIMIDTMLLMDGGFIRNFEAGELKRMGADIIIGSYTGFKRHEAHEIVTLTDIVKQIGLIGSLSDYQNEKKLADIIIEPRVSDCSPVRFDNSDSLIMRGYEAALPHREFFRKLADSIDRISPSAPPENLFHKTHYSFDRIEINGNRFYSDEQILGILDFDPGELTGKDEMRNKIDLLYGKSWFEKVKYRFRKTDDSLILAIDCIEKPRALLYGSIHYDEAVKAGVILRLSVKNPLFRRSLLDIDSYIAESYRLRIEFTRFADRNERYAFSAYLQADNTLLPWYRISGQSGGTFSRNFVQGVSVGRRYGLNHLLSLNGEYQLLGLRPDYIPDGGIKKLNTNFAAGILSYRANTLNYKHFPDKGVNASIIIQASVLTSARYLTPSGYEVYSGKELPSFRSRVYYTIRGSVNHYFTKLKKWTFHYRGDMLFTTETDTISSQNNCHLLGGIREATSRSISFPGFYPLQLQVHNIAAIQAGLDYEIIDRIHLDIGAGIAAIDDVISRKYTLTGGISAGAGYLSVIGPIRIGIMYGLYDKEEYFSRLKGYVSLGYCF